MSAENTPVSSCGIVVYRASRLEALLDPLLTLIDAAPPADVLAPTTVIAAHPGMRQWLARALARRRGPAGIVANIDIALPSAWLDQLAQRVLGESAVALAPYRREALRWRIHEALDLIDDGAMQGYLQGVDAARRRFQLADRLARIYTRYLVYRADWLRDWSAGRDAVPEATFLAPLWRHLRAQIGMPHRGERLVELARKLNESAAEARPQEPLHVFGISHLAPSELMTLQAVARRRLVVLYVPDPCREYWSGLRPERGYLRELAALGAFTESSERHYLELGHPLLASWGRLGQHFMLALAGADDVVVDIRHSEDERLPPADVHSPLLQQLQDSIRQLDPPRLRPGMNGSDTALQDRSLRIHACHTRLRELEVLRDALLDACAADATLKPFDIVVMAPDIQAYVPLMPAVFGEAGRHQGPLPYHLADVPLARSHPVLVAFDHLLDLPPSRLTAAQVLDLLEVPEIARALGLDASGVELIAGWLQRSRVAWALDGAFRERFDVPGIAEHTFAWGMDRLLAGYVLGQQVDGEAQSYRFDDGAAVVALEGIEGAQTETLGALDRLLQILAGLCRDATTPRRLSAWSSRLQDLIEAVFRSEIGDAEASEAISLLRRVIGELAVEALDAAIDPLLPFSVVRELVRERLDGLSERQRFLMGAVTCCGMVPQRAIPFRVVAVLGLNEGEFPRASSDAGLDLMTTHRRLGDRDVRSDDRYLFLETVMAARDALHLSFIGEGVRDGRPRNPAAPLGELLSLLDEAAGLRDTDSGAQARPWLLRHPLQPFDQRYFDASDPRLFSYRADLIPWLHGDGAQAAPFLPNDAAEVVPPQSGVLALGNVLAYFRRPAEHVLRQRLGLRMDALEPDRLAPSEPLLPAFSRLDRVPQRLFLDALLAGLNALPEEPPDWLRHAGLWSPGRAGVMAWNIQRAAVDALLHEVASEPLLQHEVLRRLTPAIDQLCGGLRVQGELARAYRSAGSDWIIDVFPDRSENDLDFAARIGVFLEWALLLLHQWEAPRPVHVMLPGSGERRPWQSSLNRWSEMAFAHRCDGHADAREAAREDLCRRVEGLLQFHARAQVNPAWYFPKTSWAAAMPSGDSKIVQAWEGGARHVGERDYAPGYARVLAGNGDLQPGSPAFASLVCNARLLQELICLDVIDEVTHD